MAHSEMASTRSSTLSGARRFERIKDIGEGSWGIVFKVRDRVLNQEFAVKRFKLGTERDRSEISRFTSSSIYSVSLIVVCLFVCLFLQEPMA